MIKTKNVSLIDGGMKEFFFHDVTHIGMSVLKKICHVSLLIKTRLS